MIQSKNLGQFSNFLGQFSNLFTSPVSSFVKEINSIFLLLINIRDMDNSRTNYFLPLLNLFQKKNLFSTNFKSTIPVFFIALSLLFPGKIYSQTLTFFDNLPGYDNDRGGHSGLPFLFNGKLTMLYNNNTDGSSLAEFDGNTINIIPNPAGYTGDFRGYEGEPIIYTNNLYLKFRSDANLNELAHYDGSTINIISNPTGYENPSKGYWGEPFVFAGKLFAQFTDNSSNRRLLGFDGSTYTFYANGYEFFGLDPLEYNGKIYLKFSDGNSLRLGEFDGTNVNMLPNPVGFDGNYVGYEENGFVYNGKAYFIFSANDGSRSLFEFDGTTLTPLSTPPGFNGPLGGYNIDPIAFNGKYYLTYTDNAGIESLVEFDGTNLTSIPNPAGFVELRDKFVYNGKLYFALEDTSSTKFLAEYDGTSINIILNPNGYVYENDGWIEFNGKLYIDYENESLDRIDLAIYDGTNLTIFPSPSGYDMEGGYTGGSIIYNGNLYLKYENNSGNSVLARLDDNTTCSPVTDLETARLNLIQSIKALSIPKGLKRSLIKKVNRSINKYCAGNVNKALGRFNAFINQVENKRGSHLTNTEADDLICQAHAIKDALSAGTASCSNCYNSSSSRMANPALSATMNAYPNPFDQVLTLEWQGEAQEVNISLINMQGQRVFQKSMLVKGQHSIQLEDLPSGLYILNVEGENISQNLKLLKR